LIIDKAGTVHFRAVGVPKAADLTHAVSALTEAP
jgi:hypothetical protein